MKKKWLFSIVVSFMIFGLSTPIYGEDGKNLDLNAEDIGRNNEASLTDQNDIPAFSDKYKPSKDTNIQKEDVFNGNGVQKQKEETITTKDIFVEQVATNSKVEESNQENYTILLIMLAIVLVVVTIYLTKLYQANKFRKEKQNDYYIFD